MTVDPIAHADALIEQLGTERALVVAETYSEMGSAVLYGGKYWGRVADAVRASMQKIEAPPCPGTREPADECECHEEEELNG